MVEWEWGMGNWEGRREKELDASQKAWESRDIEEVREGERRREMEKVWVGGKTKRMGSVGGCSLTKWGWIVSMTVGWWGSLASISEMRSKSTPTQAVRSNSSRWTSAHQHFSLSQAAILVTSWLNRHLNIQTDQWKLMIHWHEKMKVLSFCRLVGYCFYCCR